MQDQMSEDEAVKQVRAALSVDKQQQFSIALYYAKTAGEKAAIISSYRSSGEVPGNMLPSESVHSITSQEHVKQAGTALETLVEDLSAATPTTQFRGIHKKQISHLKRLLKTKFSKRVDVPNNEYYQKLLLSEASVGLFEEAYVEYLETYIPGAVPAAREKFSLAYEEDANDDGDELSDPGKAEGEQESSVPGEAEQASSVPGEADTDTAEPDTKKQKS